MESSLETEYPRITSNITEFWGYSMCTEYLDYLLFMDRRGRKGFSYEAMSDLMMLSAVHDYIRQTVRKIDERI